MCERLRSPKPKGHVPPSHRVAIAISRAVFIRHVCNMAQNVEKHEQIIIQSTFIGRRNMLVAYKHMLSREAKGANHLVPS
jgi:hypothetical protein